jgi:DNA-binding ferritin-like protein
MKKRLIETLEAQLIVSDPNLSITVDNMCAEWGGISYPELSVLLVHLKFLAAVHQTHHWTAKGDPYYGDHLLFERLYKGIPEEIDSIAEKSIGLGSSLNVDLTLQTAQLNRLVQGYGMTQTIPQPTELAKRSLLAEINFLATTACLVNCMKEYGTLTRGLDNLIAGIEDKHENHVYLLKQRCRPAV